MSSEPSAVPLGHEVLHDEEEPAVVDSSSSDLHGVAWRLYVSHGLSTWNARMFEFGAILFLAAIFPRTLFYASSYALVRSLAAALFSTVIGSLVDRMHRLSAVRLSIIWQRIPVAVSCSGFMILDQSSLPVFSKMLIFGLSVAMACPEKLASVANTVAIERDWVVAICGQDDIRRRDLNAVLRRIDLLAKLFAPVFISFLDSISHRTAIWTILGWSLFSLPVEYIAIAQVYRKCPELAASRSTNIVSSLTVDGQSSPTEPSDDASRRSYWQTWATKLRRATNPWIQYVASPVLLPSLAVGLLYLTVLSFGAQMVTFLISAGFTASEVSWLRLVAVAVELMATWAAPILMQRIGPVRSGLWFINWQLTWTVLAATAFSLDQTLSRTGSLAFIACVVVSRVGLWGFDLSVQSLVQEGVPEEARGRFSATEMALQNAFELLSFAATMLFARPDQFRAPVLMSVAAVAASGLLFAYFTRRVRGHLFHRSRCLGSSAPKSAPSSYEAVPQEESPE